MTLQLFTESRAQTARRCPREEHLRYQLGLVPVLSAADALRFGTVGHHALEARWDHLGAADELERALAAIAKHAPPESDAFELIRLEELVRGYVFRWASDKDEYMTLGVELEFRGPLINPETAAASRTFQRAGKLDVLLGHLVDERKLLMDHKFSGEDITPGSSFWARLKMGGQTSGYIRGAELLGHQVDGMIYDVIGKPGLRQLKATPLELRKYTKPTKAEPVPRLYANQREVDETPDEYRARVREDITAHPDAYYQRGLVVRLEEQMREHDLEAWQLAGQLREHHRLGIAPRNPDACQRYGSVCGYFAACAGEASVEDPAVYRRLEWFHPELSPPKERAQP